MDRLSRQQINKKPADLNKTIDQMDIIDISRTFYLIAAEFFSSAHGT